MLLNHRFQHKISSHNIHIGMHVPLVEHDAPLKICAVELCRQTLSKTKNAQPCFPYTRSHDSNAAMFYDSAGALGGLSFSAIKCFSVRPEETA